jgi:nucleotide-binding universal stress UspA family protein
MINIKQILCPVDFSDFSRHALQHALLLARWYEAAVTVLHTFHVPSSPVTFSGYPEPIALPAMPVPPQEVRQQASESLKRFVEEVSASGTPVSISAEAGDAVPEILKVAESLPADVIILGTHGRGGFDRAVLGSVTEKILRKAPCPVLTVPPPVSDAAPNAPVLFERILCPVDFSDSSMTALKYALSLAQEAEADLLLMHVLEGLPVTDPKLYSHFDLVGYERALTDDAAERLKEAVPDEARNWCTPEEIVTPGKPYAEILRAAKEREAHMIVMGVHGRSPVDLMLFGSTTQHVVRQAPCPVLTLRS